MRSNIIFEDNINRILEEKISDLINSRFKSLTFADDYSQMIRKYS